MEAGLNLMDAFHHAERIDDAIDEKQPFAFNESFGYLTACPTNVAPVYAPLLCYIFLR